MSHVRREKRRFCLPFEAIEEMLHNGTCGIKAVARWTTGKNTSEYVTEVDFQTEGVSRMCRFYNMAREWVWEYKYGTKMPAGNN